MLSRILTLDAAASAWDYLDAPPSRLTGADVPMPYAKNLEDNATPKPHNIVRAVERLVYRKRA